MAHNLPTSYIDFLKFVQVILEIDNNKDTDSIFNSNELNDLHLNVQNYINNNSTSTQGIREIIKLSNDNIWIQWFQKADKKSNVTWIDFEKEISSAVQMFESLYSKRQNCVLREPELSSEEKSFLCLFTDNNIKYIDISQMENIKIKMTNHLNDLIRCLELYFEDCVQKIEIKVLSPDIINLKIDKVISFNYTDTYIRLYSYKNSNVEVDFIHGETNFNSKLANNMVLGIDEYLNKKQCNKNTNFIEFKKYFQRIHKKTGCIYKNWIDEINKSEGLIHNVYIFGHSLDITDKDVLRDLILNKKTQIKIFYLDPEIYKKQIINLVHVLGKNKLIANVYGSNPKITFSKQKPMLDKDKSDWQISNDIRDLWKLHKLSTTQFDTLFKKLYKKIDQKDLLYFNNQESVISLYYVLNSTKICNEQTTKALLDICDELCNVNDITVFTVEQWADIDFRGEFSYNSNVKKFIDKVNANNSEKLNNYINTSDFDTSDLEVLYTQICDFVINEENGKTLFKHLLDLFDFSDDVELLWKCINKLKEKLSLEKWSQLVSQEVFDQKEFNMRTVRLNHIIALINEEKYYTSQIEDEENEVP